ncbi:MAG: hypothetical protein QOH93_165 [Chloroflexia bacterium]|jgi:hypothetical protein|nr:hypothetical protein [Chloroflexia bacterium]
MNWTNALGLCPRCEGPVDESQKVCSRCGLLLVAPEFLTKRLSSGFDTSVLQPAVVSRQAESRLPALVVICAVVVLATGMVLAGTIRQNNTAQATPRNTPTVIHVASVPTKPPKSLSQATRASRTPTALATATATPQPTNVQLPTSPSAPPPAPTDTPSPPALTETTVAESQPETLLPGIGSYTSDLNSWWVKLDGTGSRPVLWSPDPDTMHESQGAFWLMYVVYRNDTATPRSLGGTVEFTLHAVDGQTYPEYSGGGRDPQRKKIASVMHSNTLDFTVAPGQRTATVLVFDLPPGVQPEQLIARPLEGDTISPAGQVGWDLRRTP